MNLSEKDERYLATLHAAEGADLKDIYPQDKQTSVWLRRVLLGLLALLIIVVFLSTHMPARADSGIASFHPALVAQDTPLCDTEAQLHKQIDMLVRFRMMGEPLHDIEGCGYADGYISVLIRVAGTYVNDFVIAEIYEYKVGAKEVVQFGFKIIAIKDAHAQEI